MAETTTVNFGWTKPDPGASANTWGQTLNATTDKIDAVSFANQNAGVGIGFVSMFAGATPPTNWMICDGRALSTTTYAALFAIIGTAFNIAGVAAGNFNLPNLVQKFPIGAGPNPIGTSGGNFSVTLGPTNLPAHAHTIQDPQHYHTITDQAHGHTVNQWAHAHNIATGGHSHPIHTGAHSHGLDHQVPTTNAGGTVSPQAGGYLFQSVRSDTAGDLGGSADFVGNLGGNTDGPFQSTTRAAISTIQTMG
jgi:microcystin-dependent protein